MNEWCSLEEVYAAYLDCRKRKRTSRSCARFERNEMVYLYQLWEELNTHTYEIGYSNTFCVTRPKVREVFAADFKDRIVHHLLIKRLIGLFEKHFIPDTYNCRKGKGTDYGIKRMLEYAEKYKDGYVMICDLKGFFMSIDKTILANKLEAFIRENYHKADIESIIWITRKIALHKPQHKCRRKGNLDLWNKLDKNKSLFTNDQNCGQAIGNLTSQINANFYLSPFDEEISRKLQIDYGRYVDDFGLFHHNKAYLLALLPKIRTFLRNELHLKLHPNKLYIQKVSKGFKFTGSVIKQSRIYAGKRTIGNTINVIKYYNNVANKEEVIHDFAQRCNSYFGFLIRKKTYAIRWKLWNMISDELKKYVYITQDMAVIKIRTKYKLKTQILKSYGTTRKKRRVQRDGCRLQKSNKTILYPQYCTS